MTTVAPVIADITGSSWRLVWLNQRGSTKSVINEMNNLVVFWNFSNLATVLGLNVCTSKRRLDLLPNARANWSIIAGFCIGNRWKYVNEHFRFLGKRESLPSEITFFNSSLELASPFELDDFAGVVSFEIELEKSNGFELSIKGSPMISFRSKRNLTRLSGSNMVEVDRSRFKL